MMRPVMPNNNPGLRHLLQQQASDTDGNFFFSFFLTTKNLHCQPPQSPNSQYRPVMGMQNQQGMGGPHMGVRPPNAPYDETNFDFI